MNISLPRLMVVGAACALLSMAGSRPSGAENAPAVPAADNTRMNQGDQNPGTPTADHATQTLSDRDIMSQIRKSVVQDKSLSTYAHNVKIVARDGSVTLKGPVRTADEKQNVFAKAAAVVGAEKVQDQMTITPETR